jgi:hypothetical protein
MEIVYVRTPSPKFQTETIYVPTPCAKFHTETVYVPDPLSNQQVLSVAPPVPSQKYKTTAASTVVSSSVLLTSAVPVRNPPTISTNVPASKNLRVAAPAHGSPAVVYANRNKISQYR